MEDEKVVVRVLDGRILKGLIADFSETSDELILQEPDADGVHILKTDTLKAIFFVRTFEGNCHYNEKKSYGLRKPRGRRTFIKFIDNEDMVGFLQGDLPWDKGFFLNRRAVVDRKGFYLMPADEGSNNIRVFIFVHAVRDMTVVP